MSEDKFMPSDKLAESFLPAYLESLSEEEKIEMRNYRQFKSKPKELSIPEIKEILSEGLEGVISNLAIHFGATEISQNKKFIPIFLRDIREERLKRSFSRKFYQELHDELFQYVKEGGQISPHYQLKINSTEDGIEVYDIEEIKQPPLESFFED